MTVAVLGGTGAVGRRVVEALEHAGHEPVMVARSRGVEVVTGDGLHVPGLGYCEAKQEQERLALDGGSGVDRRAPTQFHEFPGQILDRTRKPLALVPGEGATIVGPTFEEWFRALSPGPGRAA